MGGCFSFLKASLSRSLSGILIVYLFVIPLFSENRTSRELFIEDKIGSIQKEGIYKERSWLTLLHYEEVSENKYRSYADSDSFFFSPSGKTNPSLELETSLRVFSKDEALTDLSVECLFPARFYWIRERFSIDPNVFPIPSCPKFEEFHNQMKAHSLSVVFAAFHPEHPASLFGHTMFKFNSSTKEVEELEDVVVTYAAIIPRIIDPFSYVFNGLSGNFPGSFEIQKYKYKIYEYNEYENRSLWEYKLNIDEKGIERIIRHLWEMQKNHFDYYFFDENCSFRILTLLDVGDPELRLSGRKKFLVQPADTIKLMAARKNLFLEVKFRPSIVERYRQKYGFLTESERELLRKVIKDDEDVSQQLSENRRAILYDAAIDYLLIKKSMEKGTLDEKDKERYYRYNSLRGDMGNLLKLNDYYYPPTASNPLLGHDPSQIMVSAGNSSNGAFGEFTFRPVLRDFTDSYPGYSPYNQLFFLNTNIRVYENMKSPKLQEIHFIQMTSLHPIGQFLNKASWRFDVGVKSLLTEKVFKEDPGILFGFSSFGFGVASEPFYYFSRYSLIFYSFLDVRGDISDSFRRGYRLGSIATIGMLCRITERFSFHLIGDYRSYSFGDKQYFPEFSVQGNYLLTERIALEFQYRKNYFTSLEETKFGAKLYF
ncbi:Lnb N-terminal periplasmic domain-containing protein [Leptospira borgpetersenii]|uniref:Uncharacterized protein n=1 Tax=Leptospira borgpetersenii serovar Ballum TaxID=280505 RepID=A0A0E3B434_LEPBO|nr:DUF4105 domain-containing protein [Leptospira borgpetersenii]EMO11300.1 PF13387 domain protein [Leptospira borgpetersenii str. Noumea 25]ALO24923.1 hypothetical protein LBBP_00577 [Leptospira borgpetersenii serovar Ballum]ANG99964.1 PF13387 domain protein [Leptospira borgpetersenii str. 4E]EKR02273.1 PF13387 domain protein [Leptospira borgpetersenii serovar Castellonis str. 200801910]KGE24935.1 hypothetical protein IQ66_06015 [Leptospira borgpetersenii serovar Ballum]